VFKIPKNRAARKSKKNREQRRKGEEEKAEAGGETAIDKMEVAGDMEVIAVQAKLKEADERTSGTSRENKLESLRELVGGATTGNMAKGSTRDWLDPHCYES
ncbi:hypothetical protein CFP56_001211, partial [Quercus suber]